VLEIDHLGKTYGEGDDATHAIGDISFTLAEREFVCVVGPSGCGKTTLLKCMSGLLSPTEGEVRLRDRRIVDPPPEMALVFQEYSRSLLPWMSVRGNVALPLRHKKLEKEERTRLVEEAVEAVGLPHAIDRYPWELSGGMQQRASLARLLVYDPQILLMDEPFAALDEFNRERLDLELLRLQERLHRTIVYVTHNIAEAVMLSDAVVVMTPRPGKVVDVVRVDLPRPRSFESTTTPEGIELIARIRKSLLDA
jgi:NitT/TauT family transport system ATP-binding protein